MEAQLAQPPSDPSSAAAYPRWVMLQQDMEVDAEAKGSSCSTSVASKTLAATSTSTGHLIQVYLRLTEPPGVSCACLQIPDGLDAKYTRVVAEHGDSVLIEVPHGHTTDYFVYSAGAAASDPPRPPSMSLLPTLHLGHPTGLVRRGEDLVVVAQLASVAAGPGPEPDTLELMREADLCLFRSGEWSVKRVQIRFRDASEVPGEFPSWWNAVLGPGQIHGPWAGPTGSGCMPRNSNGLLCWVDQWHNGVVLCDVLEETPRLQYLRLPMENIEGPPSNRKVCATAGGDALKFVNIFPRCCCGGAGASNCQRSSHAYTIQIWTMWMGNDDMEWVKDGMVDSSELWALDTYKGLQRFPLDHPVVSLDEPEVICFWLHEPPEDGSYWNYRDRNVDVLMVNTRSKTIHSISRYEDGLWHRGDGLIPSNVSYFFNSYLGSSGSDATFTGQRQEDIERPRPVIVDEQLKREDDDGSNSIKLASFAESSASEFFEAFQEIPSYGLDHDELKVYRILSRDNCRRFRSLLRLPKSPRKDWLLMEIKAGED